MPSSSIALDTMTIHGEMQRDKMTNRLDDRSDFQGRLMKYFRKPDGSWDLVPLVLAAVIITCAGYLYWGDQFASERPMDVPATQQLNK
jgi:hypothetical protein